MQIPEELKINLEKIASYKQNELKSSYTGISKRYMTEKRAGQSLLSSELDVLSYIIARMPATYSAVYSALKTNSKYLKQLNIKNMLDIGAGTGAATWAATQLINLEKITCLEREPNMIKLGKELMHQTNLENIITWQNHDITSTSDTILEAKQLLASPSADLVVASYMLNELPTDAQLSTLSKLLSMTQKAILIIEPGTPENHKNIMKYKEFLVNHGATIIAPCPHQNSCPLPENDWCNFEVRIERTKIHKSIKSADSPFEDEKFIYLLAFYNGDSPHCKNSTNNVPLVKIEKNARILRHPKIEKGYVELKLCTAVGIKIEKISKKQSEVYKIARKANAGDEFRNLNKK